MRAWLPLLWLFCVARRAWCLGTNLPAVCSTHTHTHAHTHTRALSLSFLPSLECSQCLWSFVVGIILLTWLPTTQRDALHFPTPHFPAPHRMAPHRTAPQRTVPLLVRNYARTQPHMVGIEDRQGVTALNMQQGFVRHFILPLWESMARIHTPLRHFVDNATRNAEIYSARHQVCFVGFVCSVCALCVFVCARACVRASGRRKGSHGGCVNTPCLAAPCVCFQALLAANAAKAANATEEEAS